MSKGKHRGGEKKKRRSWKASKTKEAHKETTTLSTVLYCRSYYILWDCITFSGTRLSTARHKLSHLSSLVHKRSPRETPEDGYIRRPRLSSGKLSVAARGEQRGYRRRGVPEMQSRFIRTSSDVGDNKKKNETRHANTHQGCRLRGFARA